MYKPTSDKFKAKMKHEGQTRQALAQHWGKSERRIGNISGNKEREQHWNDTLTGLPVPKKTKSK